MVMTAGEVTDRGRRLPRHHMSPISDGTFSGCWFAQPHVVDRSRLHDRSENIAIGLIPGTFLMVRHNVQCPVTADEAVTKSEAVHHPTQHEFINAVRASRDPCR